MSNNTAVFGIFSTQSQAEACVTSLSDAGFMHENISLLMSDLSADRKLAVEKNMKVSEGVTAGATTGGLIIGALGLLAGIGSLAIPGAGPFIAAGPIMGALAGMGAGAAAGGVLGALIGMGMSEYVAKRYEGRVKEGGILICVDCENSDWVTKAKDLLKRSGAEDISSSAEEEGDDVNRESTIKKAS